MDVVNISVRVGATMCAANFNSLFETPSRPVAFRTSIFSNKLRTVLTVGAFKGNLCCVRGM